MPTLETFARKPRTLTSAFQLSKQTHVRTFAAAGDAHHLAIVSIAIVIDTVQVTVDQIPSILKKLSD